MILFFHPPTMLIHFAITAKWRCCLALMGDPSLRRVKPAQPPLPEVTENPVSASAGATVRLPRPFQTHELLEKLETQRKAEEQRSWLQKLIELKPPSDNEALRRIHAKAVRNAKRVLGVTRTQDDIRRQGRERARRFRARQKAAKVK
jgi:hypothetical protein